MEWQIAGPRADQHVSLKTVLSKCLDKLGNIHVGQQAMVAGIKEGNAAIKEGNAALTEAIKAGFAELAQSLSGKKDPPGGSSVPAMPPVGPSHGMPGYASTGYTTTPMTPPVPPAPTVPAPAMPSACGETSAWPGTCANFNPTNLAPPKHHARLRCASFGWHVLQRKSYPHGQAMPQKHWSKNAKVLGQKKLCWKCWGKKSLRWTRKSHIGTLLPRDVSLHDCRHIEIDA